MSDDIKYTYRINLLPRETQVNGTQRMGVTRGYFPNAPERAPEPTLWRRFVYAVWRVRQWVGFAIAGYRPGEDEDL